MSEHYAINLFSGKGVPESLAETNAKKLLAALATLGSKHILAKKFGKLESPQTFFLKGN